VVVSVGWLIVAATLTYQAATPGSVAGVESGCNPFDGTYEGCKHCLKTGGMGFDTLLKEYVRLKDAWFIVSDFLLIALLSVIAVFLVRYVIRWVFQWFSRLNELWAHARRRPRTFIPSSSDDVVPDYGHRMPRSAASRQTPRHHRQ